MENFRIDEIRYLTISDNTLGDVEINWTVGWLGYPGNCEYLLSGEAARSLQKKICDMLYDYCKKENIYQSDEAGRTIKK